MRGVFLYVWKSEDIRDCLLFDTGSVPHQNTKKKAWNEKKPVFYEKKVFSEFIYVGDWCKMLNHILYILGCYLCLFS